MRKNALDVNCDGTGLERSREAVESIGTQRIVLTLRFKGRHVFHATIERLFPTILLLF